MAKGFNLEYSTAMTWFVYLSAMTRMFSRRFFSPRNQLPRQERETFMGLLRFLSLPVDDVWFSAILLILVRQGERMGKDGGRAAWCFLFARFGLLLVTNSYHSYQLLQWFGLTLEHVLVKRHGKRSAFRD